MTSQNKSTVVYILPLDTTLISTHTPTHTHAHTHTHTHTRTHTHAHFYSPPFTIQRVCELIVEPTKHYKKRDRYMRAMERVSIIFDGTIIGSIYFLSLSVSSRSEHPGAGPHLDEESKVSVWSFCVQNLVS